MNKASLITRIRRRWNKVLANRAGQSTTEYILILAIVVMIASKMKGLLIGDNGIITKSTSSVEKQLQDFNSQ